MFNASNSVRMFLFNLAVISMIAIWLTGFDKAHWFSYVLPTFLTVAAVTGFCPGLFISKKVLGVLGIKE
jgi:ABC-type polysaccharide/polyol phosphate export permease